MRIRTPLLYRKQRFQKALIKQFVVRFHMSLIIGGCFLGGVIANKVLLTMNIIAMPIRYLLAILIAYLVFFGLVRLWLFYVTKQRPDLDFIDLSGIRLPKADSCSHSTEMFAGQGGNFGGGGASGSWSSGGAGSSLAPIESQPVAMDSVADVSQGSSDLGVDFDEAAVIAFAVFAAVIAVLFGAGMYLIYDAPTILTDAAFDMALSAGLLKSLKRMDRPNWIGNVFLSTWKPFAVTASLAVVFGILAQFYCPGVYTLKDLYDTCL